jgi:hypothetical protein
VPLPGEDVFLPGTSEIQPASAVRLAGRDKSYPGNAVGLPGNAVFHPGNLKTLPGSLKSQPGSLKILPGNLKSQPGNANFLPGCLVFNGLRKIRCAPVVAGQKTPLLPSFQPTAFYLKDYYSIKKEGEYHLTIWPKISQRSKTNLDLCHRIDLKPVTIPIEW